MKGCDKSHPSTGVSEDLTDADTTTARCQEHYAIKKGAFISHVSCHENENIKFNSII